MATREARLMRWRTTAYAAWGVIGVLLLISVALYALGRIAGALAPFVLAFLFVFALQGPVAHLERLGWKRGPATAVWFIFGISAVSLFLVFIAPVIGKQLAGFAAAIPGYLAEGQKALESAQQQLSAIVLPNWVRDAALDVARSLSNVFVRLGNVAAAGLVTAGGGFVTVVFDLFIAGVIAFWTLKDLPKIRTELAVLAGEKYEEDVENLLATIGRMVGGYLKGQTIASLVTGVIATIGLWLLGVPFPIVLGIITFIFNYIPYVGPFVAGVIAAVLGLFQGPLIGLGAIVVVVASQNLTDIFVTPRVMSDQVDLHPTLVIFSLLVGGSLFGFWGMIFAIPVAATAKALFVYYYERKTERQLATEDGALFKAPVCEDGVPEPCTPPEGDAGEPKDESERGPEPAEGASA